MQPLIDSINNMFQSTLPRRERPQKASEGTSPPCFNPRSREGSDGQGKLSDKLDAVFQSTLPRRERPTADYQINRLIVSIHAPAKGATSPSSKMALAINVSIHAPAKGATKLSLLTPL